MCCSEKFCYLCGIQFTKMNVYMRKFRSILVHVSVIAAVSLVVLVISILGYIIWQTGQHKELVKAAKIEHQNMSEKIWKAKSENFQNAVRDNSAWDELVDFTENYNPKDIDSAWLEDNFGYMLDSYSASMVAIFNRAGDNLYHKVSEGYEDYDFFSLDFILFAGKIDRDGTTNFYMYDEGCLMEFFGAKITNSSDNDHKGPSRGFLMLAREITPDVIEDYRISTGALYIGVFPNDSTASTVDVAGNNIIISRELDDYSDDKQAFMCSVFENSVEKFFDDMKPVFGVFALICLIALGNILLFMRNEIAGPLSKISRSLASSNSSEIKSIMLKNNEFGQVAEMLDAFYQQQEEIRVQNETLKEQSEEIALINADLSDQKDRLADANRQLTDSINYAGRIQRAAVSSKDSVAALFPDSMVIYRPKDIVSGDWFFVTGRRGKKIVVVADCTGHGVPGSLLSMLGISAFKDIVNGIDIKGEPLTPELILNRMRTSIKTTLIKSDDDIMSLSDGMDVGIGIFDDGLTTMRFAGANHSLLLCRGGEVSKISGNRMPIGNYIREDDFTGVDVPIESGDGLFFMSDGIKDQTNPDLKKFKSVRVEAFIIENSSLPMQKFGEKLNATIDAWMDGSAQIDDMTMIAIRV